MAANAGRLAFRCREQRAQAPRHQLPEAGPLKRVVLGSSHGEGVDPGTRCPLAAGGAAGGPLAQALHRPAAGHAAGSCMQRRRRGEPQCSVAVVLLCSTGRMVPTDPAEALTDAPSVSLFFNTPTREGRHLHDGIFQAARARQFWGQAPRDTTSTLGAPGHLQICWAVRAGAAGWQSTVPANTSHSMLMASAC